MWSPDHPTICKQSNSPRRLKEIADPPFTLPFTSRECRGSEFPWLNQQWLNKAYLNERLSSNALSSVNAQSIQEASLGRFTPHSVNWILPVDVSYHLGMYHILKPHWTPLKFVFEQLYAYATGVFKVAALFQPSFSCMFWTSIRCVELRHSVTVLTCDDTYPGLVESPSSVWLNHRRLVSISSNKVDKPLNLSSNGVVFSGANFK